ncbi:MAG: CPBP family intramembrane metalloprotease [Acidobacteriia bacterium]|nr:CPBP family intramembrane metalloprotease [Terriglobia bacterium]
MSLTPNSLPEINPLGPTPEAAPPSISEDPPWTGWDVLQIAVLTLVATFVLVLVVTLGAQHLLYPRKAIIDVAKFPLVTIVAQVLAYGFVLAFMVAIVKNKSHRSFSDAIQWNWPDNWAPYFFGGVVLSFGLQGIAHLVPIPKELPMDRFFQTTGEAWALAVFGVTLAPLLEELFFRGFLYPVLVRRAGVTIAIVLTAAGFSLIHAPQLGKAWGPVLVIFLVGLVLTFVRAKTKSVAAGVVMHVAYNGTISALLFVATDGFRHLEKLNQ